MALEWFGQSAFRLDADGKTIAIDPFGHMSALSRDRGIQWDYPVIEGVEPDLLLVTHEHGDHNAVEAIDETRTSCARRPGSRTNSPIGNVMGVAARARRGGGHSRPEHDLRVRFRWRARPPPATLAMGSRPEQADAIGEVDLLFVPVGGGLTPARPRPRRSSSA